MKRLIALTLSLMSIVAILCSCGPKQNINSSSTVAEAESSAIASEETKSEVSSNKTSSIKKDKSSSKKEEKPSSKKEDSSRAPSKRNETTSASTSSSVKLPTLGNTMEIGCFQFTPYYCINYKDEYVAINDGDMSVPIEKKLEEFEDVLKEGYFNTVFLNYYDINNEKLWQIIEKYNVTVWMMIASGYRSTSGITIDEWMEGHLKPFNII